MTHGITSKARKQSPLTGIAEAPSARPPDRVMRSEQLGAFHQTRLSFSRAVVRQMRQGGWQIERRSLNVGDDNTGEALYSVDTPHGRYSFLALSHDIPASERTDRAIARAWDYTFALCEGEIDVATRARLGKSLPIQDDGRYLSTDLVFSRANKSGRLFDNVVAALAAGRQPDAQSIIDVGYLIRTTAVFANGKFGLADYGQLRRRGAFPHTFAAQMLTVFLIRQFSVDLVDHLAREKAPCTAIPLDPRLKRLIGVGNATGLGMAPFIVDHPRLFHHWVGSREAALARVIAKPQADEARWSRFLQLHDRAIRHVRQWRTEDERQLRRLETLAKELIALRALWTSGTQDLTRHKDHPWRRLMDHAARNCSAETEEMLLSLVLEPHGDLIDDLADNAPADETEGLTPELSIAELRRLIEADYAWVIATDFHDPRSRHFFWYRSEVKGEPRLGISGVDDGQNREMTVGIGPEVVALHRRLAGLGEHELRNGTVGDLLFEHPEHRAITERILSLRGLPYAEVRDNLLSADYLPIDLLRCKLAFLGATRFDPKSDRWVRVVLFQGAPLVSDLVDRGFDADDWLFPCWE